MTERRLDVICLGRCGVDLYSEQVGGRLEDVQSFAKYVGGCPANIAVGTARLGLKSALISRVGDEHMGRFIKETLRAEGVDISHVSTDPERLTALVILGIRNPSTFPHIFYRENCADVALAPEHIDSDFIASARALVVTGTHLSRSNVEAASRTAIRYARDAGMKVALDIDYRPVLWGLTGADAGDERFVADASVTRHLGSILADCDLVVGTEEEIHIAAGNTNTLDALCSIRNQTDAVIVLKRGAAGCVVVPAEIPATLEQGIVSQGFPVEVFNTLGAGDAFVSGLLHGWLNNESWESCCQYANACGAIVVSRHGCAPAMPSAKELTAFLADERHRMSPELDRLHRVATRKRHWQQVCALAFDHRKQLEELADRYGVDHSRITDLKRLIAEGARRGAREESCAGAIIDGRYGSTALAELSGRGWWLARPVEAPGSRPLVFEHGPNVALSLRSWPEEQIAKCLVFYHPDDDETLRREQENQLLALYAACVATGHELLVEVIPPNDLPVDSTTLARSLAALYERGMVPDWWKLPPPPDLKTWQHISSVIDRYDPYCRGIVLLGLDAPEAELKHGFDAAAGQPLCKGFAVGRSIFRAAAEAWFGGKIDDKAVVNEVAEKYRRVIELWEKRGR